MFYCLFIFDFFFFQFYLFHSFSSPTPRGEEKEVTEVEVQRSISPILLRDGDTVGVKVSVCIPHR